MQGESGERSMPGSLFRLCSTSTLLGDGWVLGTLGRTCRCSPGTVPPLRAPPRLGVVVVGCLQGKERGKHRPGQL